MMSQFSKTNKSSIMKSSQRDANAENGRKTNIYKRRPMSVFDNNRVVNNYTMATNKPIDICNQKGAPKAVKVPFSHQNTIDKRRQTVVKQPFKDINKIQSKLEKNLYKLEMRSNVSPDRMYSDATTATASHDERRISIYLRALEEITKSNPESMGWFMYIRENLEKLFHSLIYKKKEQNESLSDQIENIKKETTKERKLKENIELKNTELQAQIDKIIAAKQEEEAKFKKALSQLKNKHQDSLDEISNKNSSVKGKVQKLMKLNEQLSQQVKVLRKREIEIVKRWDLDDVDLVTERLKILKTSQSYKKNSKKRNKVPKLDLTRVYEIQNEQNEEYEEEEEEEEDEFLTQHKGYFVGDDGLVTSDSMQRELELQK